MFGGATDSGALLPRGELARLVSHVAVENTARTRAERPVAVTREAFQPPTGDSLGAGLPVPPDVAMPFAEDQVAAERTSGPALGEASSPATPGLDRLPVALGGTLDPEVFAHAVAAAVAAVLEARPDLLAPRPGTAPWIQATPLAAPGRRSFWAGLWHADVLLAVLAMLIILVVLLAWAA